MMTYILSNRGSRGRGGVASVNCKLDNRYCYICSSPSHIARSCPQKMQCHSEGQGTVRKYKCMVSQSADGEYIVRGCEQVSKGEKLGIVRRLTDSENEFIELSWYDHVVCHVNGVNANGLRISPLEYMDIYVSEKRVKACDRRYP